MTKRWTQFKRNTTINFFLNINQVKKTMPKLQIKIDETRLLNLKVIALRKKTTLREIILPFVDEYIAENKELL